MDTTNAAMMVLLVLLMVAAGGAVAAYYHYADDASQGLFWDPVLNSLTELCVLPAAQLGKMSDSTLNTGIGARQ